MKKTVNSKVLALLLSLVVLIASTSQTSFASENSKSYSDKINPTIVMDSSSISSEQVVSDPSAKVSFKDSTIENIKSIPNFLQKSNKEIIKDSNRDTVYAVQYALPDLKLSLLRTSESQPLDDSVTITFQVTLTNIGSAPATNPVISLYEDNNWISDLQITGTIAAGTQGTFSYGLTNNAGGSHTLKAVINRTHSITESDYSNNTTQATFIWKDAICLIAEGISPSDGITSYESNTTKKFTYVVSNYGNIPARSVTCGFYLNDAEIGQYTYDQVPSHTRYTNTVTITINKAGSYEFKYTIDPDHVINEIKRDDNSASVNLGITYDTEIWAGRWANANDLNVKVCNSAVNTLNNSNASSNPLLSAENAIWAWNGIVTNVSFGNINFTNDEEYDGTVNLVAISLGSDGTLALTNVFKQENGSLTLIQHPTTDSSDYVSATVELNTVVFPTATAAQQARTITHEFGHVLGLKHPTCGDKAIMWQTADKLVAYSIQGHDIYNLQVKYS